MPFIGDRYYMNPLFGAAVERSRVGDDVLPDEDSDSSGLHVAAAVAWKKAATEVASAPLPRSTTQKQHAIS